MTLVNLTPHALMIVIDRETGKTITVPPTGKVARVTTIREPGAFHDGVPTFKVTFGSVTGLPDMELGKVFVVSGMVASHPSVRQRPDVFSPGELIRDAGGIVVGCHGLVCALE